MNALERTAPRPLLLLIAGAKGAVGSTIAVAAAALRKNPSTILPFLTTANRLPEIGPPQEVEFSGWDRSPRTLIESLAYHGVLPEGHWQPCADDLGEMKVLPAPPPREGLRAQVEHLLGDIHELRNSRSHCQAVFVNLLPACSSCDLSGYRNLEEALSGVDPEEFPDMAYVVAAMRSGLPVINFTPNHVEWPVLLDEALRLGVPLAGRDGKTGQTYLKVVIASALQARHLRVDGWYSVNILGNEDGRNLDDPVRAAGKVANKTQLLDEILGYKVGERYGSPSHRVRIDYYPPRGDAKEAWDVIDFLGLFGLPMSLRLNLLARDSILAAPLILDLACWMGALQRAGKAGPIAELAFYFKKPVGPNPPLTFQDQIARLEELERACLNASAT